jgi:hypothetical protein
LNSVSGLKFFALIPLTGDDVDIHLYLVLGFLVVRQLPVVLVNGYGVVGIDLLRDIRPSVLEGIAVKLRQWILSKSKLEIIQRREIEAA